MGMTFATLHLYGVEKLALTPLLAQGDLLRELNVPWLSVVPAYDPEHRENDRLEKQAKRLTKGNEGAAALLFYYFDDDWFRCCFYRSGRKLLDCGSRESWSKLGKQLNLLFGEDAPAKALRYGPRCFGLEEQIRLLEETIGAALYDIPEEEARRVPRGDATLRAIKAREAALRKRPNQFVLTELPPEEWPESVRVKMQLYELLRPQGSLYRVSLLFGYIGNTAYVIPQHRSRLAYPYTDKAHVDHLILYDGVSGEIADRSFPGEITCAPLWLTKDGALIYLFAEIERETVTGSSWSRSGGRNYVRCLAPDGGERWRFVPEMNEHQCLQHISTSADGIITLLASAIDGEIKADGLLFQLDGETGQLLNVRRVPAEDGMFRLAAVPALDAFVYDSMHKKELVLLDGKFQEKARRAQHDGRVFPAADNICGRVLWSNNYYVDPRSVELYNLETGGYEKLRLEIPALILARLADGRLLGINEKQTHLTVFDNSGAVAARCSVPGMLTSVWQEDDQICIVEARETDSPGQAFPEMMDEKSIHVWRLDPA